MSCKCCCCCCDHKEPEPPKFGIEIVLTLSPSVVISILLVPDSPEKPPGHHPEPPACTQPITDLEEDCIGGH